MRTVPRGGQSARGGGRVLEPIERQDYQLPRPFRRASERCVPELPREIRSCPELVFGRAPGAGHQVRRLPHHSSRGLWRVAWGVPRRSPWYTKSNRVVPADERKLIAGPPRAESTIR